MRAGTAAPELLIRWYSDIWILTMIPTTTAFPIPPRSNLMMIKRQLKKWCVTYKISIWRKVLISSIFVSENPKRDSTGMEKTKQVKYVPERQKPVSISIMNTIQLNKHPIFWEQIQSNVHLERPRLKSYLWKWLQYIQLFIHSNEYKPTSWLWWQFFATKSSVFFDCVIQWNGTWRWMASTITPYHHLI